MIVVYVPIEHTEAVRLAMCEAGAGTVDDRYYDQVTYVSPVGCRYRVLDKTGGTTESAGQEYES